MVVDVDKLERLKAHADKLVDQAITYRTAVNKAKEDSGICRQ
jgi:hypothetical protein